MQLFPPTVVWRHRKENLKKCSLRGLENRPDFKFYPYPGELPDLTHYIILDINAPVLEKTDAVHGLFIIDATWRYAAKMLSRVTSQKLIPRSIPTHFLTAYPRRQDDCPFPDRGLASIEAIFIAYHIFERKTEGLLDHYHWKEEFLKRNF